MDKNLIANNDQGGYRLPDAHLNDPLWILARKRVAFKRTLPVYLAVNLFLVVVWYFTSGPGTYFWPVWSIIGWGFGLALRYFSVYHDDRFFTVEGEYEALKNKYKNS